MTNSIQTDRFSAALRTRGIDSENRRVRITRYDGSLQAEDLSLPTNCGGWGRIHHFRRHDEGDWPPNPLPIDPASRWLGLDYPDSLHVQVFQNAICSWRCWYCFVDFPLLSADPRYSDFKSVDDIIDLYLSEDSPPPVIDLSGGQPDLVPEWVLWFLDAISRRGLEQTVYVWSDDNLSNDYLWKYLSSAEIKRLLRYRNYGRVGCFKGFDENSFSFNTQAEPESFSRQFGLMRRIVDAGFDVYGYATFTSDRDDLLATRMADFVDRLQEQVHPLFPLRLVPLKIKPFTPMRRRITEHHRRAFKIQETAVLAWTEELARRFSQADLTKRVFEHGLSRN